LNAIERILSKIEDILHIAGCLALVLVAVLLNIDIGTRLFAGHPLQIQFEMTELFLMPALATLSLSRVFRDGGHLSLDIVPESLMGPAAGIVRRLRLLLAVGFFGCVTWMSGKYALRAFHRGDIEFGVLDWPLGWAYAAIPLGCAVLVLRLAFELIKSNERVNASPPESIQWEDTKCNLLER
jgi:TRAP-type C4-dicarboxylate transport system permease small subunit